MKPLAEKSGKNGATAASSPADAAPVSPGVYVMKDETGTVLYVGMAKNLRSRVRSYYRVRGDARPSVPVLRDRVRTIEYITTHDEGKAALLEDRLIKEYQPRYNFDLKDDKRYYSVKVTLAEEFPRIMLCHQRVDDGSLYFGPFASSRRVKQMLKSLQEKHQLRRCPGAKCRRNGPCLYAQINLCSAPCAGKATRVEYLERIDRVLLHLKRAEQMEVGE